MDLAKFVVDFETTNNRNPWKISVEIVQLHSINMTKSVRVVQECEWCSIHMSEHDQITIQFWSLESQYAPLVTTFSNPALQTTV